MGCASSSLSLALTLAQLELYHQLCGTQSQGVSITQWPCRGEGSRGIGAANVQRTLALWRSPAGMGWDGMGWDGVGVGDLTNFGFGI